MGGSVALRVAREVVDSLVSEIFFRQEKSGNVKNL